MLLQVWGAEATGAVHNPPHDIIWRNQSSWGAGSNAVTKLVSKSGEVSSSTSWALIRMCEYLSHWLQMLSGVS